jgi:Damage-control phosphatase ARMT1-like domain
MDVAILLASISLMFPTSRAFIGDCKWDMTASFEDVVGAYFPCPVCALRTLKAEIGCGMDAPRTLTRTGRQTGDSACCILDLERPNNDEEESSFIPSLDSLPSIVAYTVDDSIDLIHSFLIGVRGTSCA